MKNVFMKETEKEKRYLIPKQIRQRMVYSGVRHKEQQCASSWSWFAFHHSFLLLFQSQPPAKAKCYPETCEKAAKV